MPSQFTVLMVIAAALAGGVALVAVLSLVPATAARGRGLWQPLATEFVIVGAAVFAFLLGPVAVQVATVLLAARVGWESAKVACPSGARALVPIAGGATFAVAAAAAIWCPIISTTMLPAASAIAFVLGCVSLATRHVVLPAPAGPALRVAIYPGLAVVCFALAARDPRVHGALLFAFLMTEIFDSFSLLAGRLFGRHPLFPVLSPRKTFEGLFAGCVALAVAAASFTLAGATTWTIGLVCVVLTAAGALLGDLAASAPKRAAGVKDYPTILPGQGGLLDIVDSWIVTGPLFAAASIVLT